MSPNCPVCRFEVGMASCFDEEDYDQLGEQYDEAVANLTNRYGLPIAPTPTFLETDLDKATCWKVDQGVVYAMLDFGDNTRIRMLTLGLARPGTVVSGCWSEQE